MRDSLDKLNTLVNNERSAGAGSYSLENMNHLLGHFGSPQKNLTIVHAAGTNGKGSFCYMLNAILSAARIKTGLYTSPHLESVRERIMINNTFITEDAFSRYTSELFDLLEKRKDLLPTYFDALTLIALRFFSDENVDVAILETGLGGRLDSTNCADSLVSVITDIGIDHSHILGGTLREIAEEKAGIIKPGSFTITSNTDPEVLQVIERHAREADSQLHVYGKDFCGVDIIRGEAGPCFDFIMRKPGPASIEGLPLPSPVRAQVKNACLAAAAAMILDSRGFIIPTIAVRQGLEGLTIPGRYQVLSRRPVIIFDPAHNPEAVTELVRTLRDQYPGKNFIAVLSFMRDKEYRSMIRIIQESLTGDIVYHELDDPRAVRGNEVNREPGNIGISASPDDLRRIFHDARARGSIVIATGSFRLYSAVKHAAEQNGDPLPAAHHRSGRQ